MADEEKQRKKAEEKNTIQQIYCWISKNRNFRMIPQNAYGVANDV